MLQIHKISFLGIISAALVSDLWHSLSFPHPQRLFRLNSTTVGRRARGLYSHADQAPGTRLQCGLQSRRQAPGQRLLWQVCPHLEHHGKCLIYAIWNGSGENSLLNLDGVGHFLCLHRCFRLEPWCTATGVLVVFLRCAGTAPGTKLVPAPQTAR